LRCMQEYEADGVGWASYTCAMRLGVEGYEQAKRIDVTRMRT
jgi:hypothetical protein